MKAVQLQAGAPAEGQEEKIFFHILKKPIQKIVIKDEL